MYRTAPLARRILAQCMISNSPNRLYSFLVTHSTGHSLVPLPFKSVSNNIVEKSSSLRGVLIDFYAISFPHDRPLLKSFVFGIFLIEMTQTFLLTHDTFDVFALGWGDLNQLEDIHLTWLDTPIMSGIGEFKC